jgi:hypothetical protein
VTKRPVPKRTFAAKEAEDIPASHGGSPGFEDALRLRAGSLGIKAPLRERPARVNSQGTHGPMGLHVSATWNVVPSGSLAVSRHARIADVLRPANRVRSRCSRVALRSSLLRRGQIALRPLTARVAAASRLP